jgi:hypothetical protein
MKLLAGAVAVGKHSIASVLDTGEQHTVKNCLASLRKKINSITPLLSIKVRGKQLREKKPEIERNVPVKSLNRISIGSGLDGAVDPNSLIVYRKKIKLF